MKSDFFPYSLAYEHNPIFPLYQKTFFHELIFAWRKCIASLEWAEDLLDIPQDSLKPFFHIPEISANLLIFLKEDSTEWDLQLARDIIRQEAKKFFSGWKETLTAFQAHTIPGTNILLGSSEQTAHISRQPAHPSYDIKNIHSLFWSVDEIEWQRLYGKSFSIIKKVAPWFFHEMQEILSKIVPFGISKGSHNSCSYPTIIGVIYASYPVEYDEPEIAVLEALIHEYNHNKIHLIMRVDQLILNDKQTIYYSPYRPDARHIQGIYLWLHAMVATYYVTLLCLKEWIITKESQFFRKTIGYILKNQLSINTLKRYWKFTSLWTELFEDMLGVHELSLDILKSIDIDKDVLRVCREHTRDHFYRAKASNRILYY